MIDSPLLTDRERALVCRAVVDTLDFLLTHGLIQIPNDRDAPPYEDERRLQIEGEGLARLAALRKIAVAGYTP